MFYQISNLNGQSSVQFNYGKPFSVRDGTKRDRGGRDTVREMGAGREGGREEERERTEVGRRKRRRGREGEKEAKKKKRGGGKEGERGEEGRDREIEIRDL